MKAKRMCGAVYAEESVQKKTVPELPQWAGSIPLKFQKWDVVAVPDKDEAEWWAGAPSVTRDKVTFW